MREGLPTMAFKSEKVLAQWTRLGRLPNFERPAADLFWLLHL